MEKSVIWLHGLGASGDDFVPVVPELKLPASPGIRFVFPHAPMRPITINGGMTMPGWYDITSLDFEAREQDLEGMADSVAIVERLMADEIAAGVEPTNIVLAGFSQGGAIALMAALQTRHPIAGVMGLSTYLPDGPALLEKFAASGQRANGSLPVFMAHGTHDEVIQIRFAQDSHELLRKSENIEIEWRTYPMPHSVSPEEIGDIATWLRNILNLEATDK